MYVCRYTGTVGVSTAVLKDGHQFLVHVLDPRVNPEEGEDVEETEDGTEKADEEKNEKTGLLIYLYTLCT